MAGRPRVTDAQVLAAQEIWNAAEDRFREEIEKLKEEIKVSGEQHEAIGILKANRATRKFTELVDAIVLYKVHKEKAYKKVGLTFEGFCSAVGIERRTAYNIINDMKGVYNEFCETISHLSNLNLNEIRLLGRAKCENIAHFENDHLIYKDQKISLHDREALQAVLDDIRDEMRRLREEKEEDIKALKRVSQSKDEVIQRLEKEIQRLEGQAKKKGITPEEQAFLKKVETFRKAFDGVMVMVDPERLEDLRGEKEPTLRMKVAYIELLDYMRRQVNTAYQFAMDIYGGPQTYPESDVWEPPQSAREEKE